MNKFSEKSRKSYNAIADCYDDTFDGKFTLEFKHRLLKEIHTGRGPVFWMSLRQRRTLKMLEDRFGILGYGTDTPEKMIENAAARNPEMVFRAAGCEDIPFESQSFELLTVCAAYHHFPDVGAFAAEAHRLLKPGGYLFIADVYYSAFPRFLCNLVLPLSKAGDVRFYSPEEIVEVFERMGFKEVKTAINGRIQIVALQKIGH
jgi:SAM-dependent methyltransferase